MEVDDRVPGGLVALVYDGFTVVEVASAAEAFPIMAKLAPSGVTVSSAAVNGRFAVWVGGAHPEEVGDRLARARHGEHHRDNDHRGHRHPRPPNR